MFVSLFVSHCCTIQYCSAERHLIGVFQFVTNGDAAGDDAYHNIVGCEFTRYIEVGCIALQGGTECQYHLLYSACRDTLYKRIDLYVARSIGDIIPPST